MCASIHPINMIFHQVLGGIYSSIHRGAGGDKDEPVRFEMEG